jgi:hypothetical protein
VQQQHNEIFMSEVESAIEFSERTRTGISKKANHNKHEALIFFIIIISCTLAAPLFITLAPGFWFPVILVTLRRGSNCLATATKTSATLGALPRRSTRNRGSANKV